MSLFSGGASPWRFASERSKYQEDRPITWAAFFRQVLSVVADGAIIAWALVFAGTTLHLPTWAVWTLAFILVFSGCLVFMLCWHDMDQFVNQGGSVFTKFVRAFICITFVVFASFVPIMYGMATGRPTATCSIRQMAGAPPAQPGHPLRR
jgi:hypothetical protein